MADESGARYTRGCYGFDRVGQRSVCRIRSVRCHGFWNESCLRWVHCCGLGGRSCRNGGSIFCCAQKSSRFEREHCTGQRRADCALRCSGSGTAELCNWPHADGFESLARGSRDDSVRNTHRVFGDHVWPLCVVRRRARPDGLPDFRHGSLPFAAIGRQLNPPVDALASAIERTKVRFLAECTLRAVSIGCDATISAALRRRLRSKTSAEQKVFKKCFSNAWCHDYTYPVNRFWVLRYANFEMTSSTP